MQTRLPALRPWSRGTGKSKARAIVFAAALTAGVLSTAPARAADSEPHRLQFPFREASAVDYAMLATGYAAYGVLGLLVPPAHEARWASPVLIDGRARHALIAPTRAARSRADLVSDVGVVASLALLAGDSIVVAGVLDANLDVALELALMDAQVFALSGTLLHALQLSVARERPDIAPCDRDATHSEQCGRSKNTSFPSGHATMVFASAATYCAHRLKLEVYGHPVADAIGCGVQVGNAFASSLLRVVADRHYPTDVAAGALLGTALGLGVPLFVRATTEKSSTARSLRLTLTPSFGATPGLLLGGAF